MYNLSEVRQHHRLEDSLSLLRVRVVSIRTNGRGGCGLGQRFGISTSIQIGLAMARGRGGARRGRRCCWVGEGVFLFSVKVPRPEGIAHRRPGPGPKECLCLRLFISISFSLSLSVSWSLLRIVQCWCLQPISTRLSSGRGNRSRSTCRGGSSLLLGDRDVVEEFEPRHRACDVRSQRVLRHTHRIVQNGKSLNSVKSCNKQGNLKKKDAQKRWLLLEVSTVSVTFDNGGGEQLSGIKDVDRKVMQEASS